MPALRCGEMLRWSACCTRSRYGTQKRRPVKTGRRLKIISPASVGRRRHRVDLVLHTRVLDAVEEVDEQAERHPDHEPGPRVLWQPVHHVAANQNAENWYDRHERRTEWTRNIRPLVPEHHHAEADDHECEQRPDRYELAQKTDREEASNRRRDDAGNDGGDVRRLEARMDLAENRRKQAIARHREEDA